MTRTRKMIPIGLLLALVALVSVVFMVRASADDMLHQSARLLSEATDGHAVLAFELNTPEQSGSGVVELWGKLNAGPNGEPAFRLELLETSLDKGAGMVAVSDGTQFWVWDPSENTVYTGVFAELRAMMTERAAEFEGEFDPDDFNPADYDAGDMPATPEEAVDRLLEYFEAERAGTETVGGVNANKLRLIPIAEKMPEALRANGGLLYIWLRTGDAAPLAAEYAGGAVGAAKVTATSLELNQGVDPALFTFTIPEGATVVNVAELEPETLTLDEAAATAAFPVLSPAALPEGARLLDVVEVRGAVVQRYAMADGGRFTVAQGPSGAADVPAEGATAVTVRGVEGLLYANEGAARALLTWAEGDLVFWVGGDLSPAAALAIADSLQ